MEALVAVETLLLVLLALLVVALLRSHAEVLRRLGPPADAGGERLAPGVPPPPERRDADPAPDVAGTTPFGEAIQVALAPGGPSTLLAFLSSTCLTCEGFWRSLAAGDAPLPDGVRVVVVTKGASHESPSRLRELAPRAIPVVMSSQAWADYEVPTSPYFAYVDGPSGRIHGVGSATGWEQVASLLRDALADYGAATGEGARPGSSAWRASRVEAELAAAGIGPGHPSLYPSGSEEGAEG